MSKQDSSFYTNQEGAETVWQEQGNPYYVVRNGEMRIHYNDRVIRYTDDLEDNGITTDKQVYELMDSNCFVNNSWFEVWHSTDTEYYSEPLHELNEAIEHAKELNNAELVR
jgi:hypothetical protein